MTENFWSKCFKKKKYLLFCGISLHPFLNINCKHTLLIRETIFLDLNYVCFSLFLLLEAVSFLIFLFFSSGLILVFCAFLLPSNLLSHVFLPLPFSYTHLERFLSVCEGACMCTTCFMGLQAQSLGQGRADKMHYG